MSNAVRNNMDHHRLAIAIDGHIAFASYARKDGLLAQPLA